MLKNRIFQISILVGTVIGAGIFALPFVFKSSGLSIGLFYLGIAVLAHIFIYWMYADVILRTEGQHRFLGYSQIYLGKSVFLPVILMTVAQMIVVLAIYLILSRSFSNLIFPPYVNIYSVLAFWFLGSLPIIGGLKKISLLEFLITSGIIAIIILIFVVGSDNFWRVGSEFFAPDFSKLLLPLAPVIFAFSGRVAIPSLVRVFPAGAKSSIVFGILLPAIVYGIFVFSIVGLSAEVSMDSVSGLIDGIPPWILFLIGVFGILSLWSSYITVGFDVYESLFYDLKFPRLASLSLVIGLPLLVYFLSFQSFLALVGLVGGVFLAVEGILMVMIWRRANKISPKPSLFFKTSPRLGIAFILLVFGAALIYEISKFL